MSQPRQPVKQVPVDLAEQLSAAQVLVYERHASVAEARAVLTEADASLGHAMADLNKLLHSVLALPQTFPGEGESGFPT
ncbi:hypothetical protein ACIQJX_35060 [Streptomyces griseoviridis]